MAVDFYAITLYLAVFGVWLADFVSSDARARLVLFGDLAGAVVCAALGIAALTTPIGAFDRFGSFDLRAKGPFGDQNVFGPFMVPLILILFEELLNPRMLRMRSWTKLALLLFLSAAVVLSFSRGAWMNAVVGLAVVFVVLTLRRGGVTRPGETRRGRCNDDHRGFARDLTERLRGVFPERTGLQEYDSERFAGQREGLSVAESHPLGIGPGQFEGVVKFAAHSTFVRVFAEQGPLGLVALLALFVATLVLARRNAVVGRHTYGIGSAALLGAWCGLIANSFFVDTLHWRHLWMVAALIWAGTIAIARRTARRGGRCARRSPTLAGTPPSGRATEVVRRHLDARPDDHESERPHVEALHQLAHVHHVIGGEPIELATSKVRSASRANAWVSAMPSIGGPSIRM